MHFVPCATYDLLLTAPPRTAAMAVWTAPNCPGRSVFEAVNVKGSGSQENLACVDLPGRTRAARGFISCNHGTSLLGVDAVACVAESQRLR